jgi:hypothetical protein
MNQFEELTSQNSNTTVIGDLLYFLRHGKKWWMVPIIVLVLLFGTLMLLGGTVAAPFIYTLF